MLWLWPPLAFLLVALAAGTAFCAVCGLRAYRQLRSLGRSLAGELAGFSERLERTQRPARGPGHAL